MWGPVDSRTFFIITYFYTGIYIWLYLLSGFIAAKIVSYFCKVKGINLSSFGKGAVSVVSVLFGIIAASFVLKNEFVNIFLLKYDKEIFFPIVLAFLSPLIVYIFRKKSFSDFLGSICFYTYVVFIFFVIFVNIYSVLFAKLGYCSMTIGKEAQNECWYNSAIKNQDINLCNRTDKLDKTDCFSAIALSAHNSAICEKSSSYGLDQDRCYKETALNNLDENACKSIKDNSDRNICVYTIAGEKQNLSICNDFFPVAPMEYRMRCYEHVTGERWDWNKEDFCYRFEDSKDRAYCIYSALSRTPSRCEALAKEEYSAFKTSSMTYKGHRVDVSLSDQCFRDFVAVDNIGNDKNDLSPDELMPLCHKIVNEELRDDCEEHIR